MPRTELLEERSGRPDRLGPEAAARFFAAHVILGIAADRIDGVPTAHAFAACAVALWITVRTARIDRALAAIAYVAVCDVLWRSTGARFFYEGGKYATALLCIVVLLRFIGTPRRLAGPTLYLAAFAPGTLLTILLLGPGARGTLSVNLSGPIALATSAILGLQLRSDLRAVRLVLTTMLGPIVAVWSIATLSTVTNDAIEFTAASNFVASGGFGPNQVSTLLGFGGLVCALLAMTEARRSLIVVDIVVGTAFLTQAALTFSRGGLITPGIAVVVGLIALARTTQSRVRITIGTLVLAGVAAVVIVPNLDEFTGGALTERFTNLSTIRTDLASRDLEFFAESPLLGIGVGVAEARRSETMVIAAHTEFTRLLAEQGIFGLVAMFALFGMAISAVRRAPAGRARAIGGALAIWSIVSMGHSAMRIAAIPFALGLACVVPGLTRASAPVRVAVRTTRSGGERGLSKTSP